MNDLWARVVPSSARLAYALTGDRERAASIARKTFVRLYARFQDLRDPYAIEMWTRRTVVRLARPTAAPGDAVDAPDGRVWRAFLRLRRRRRAALALRFVERLDAEAIADVLGCSPPGARSLVDRGLAAIAPAASPGSETADELANVLEGRVEGVEVPLEFEPAIGRRARLLRAVGAVTVLSLIAVTAAGAVTGTRALVGRAAAEEADDRLEPAEDEFDVGPAPVTARADRSPVGAPAWCPPPGPFDPMSEEALLDVGSAATRFAIALALSYDSAHTQSLKSENSPPVTKWPRTREPVFAVVQSDSAAADRALIRACGPSAAEDTWKVVMREREAATADDVLGVYLVRSNEAWKVWATLRGPARE